MESLITLGYYVSSLGFLIASIIALKAVKASSQSILKNVLMYIFIGSGTFFAITVFQKLGGDFFAISDESMDVWWHVMFYLAMFSFYFAFKALVAMGTSENNNSVAGAISAKTWGIFSVIVLAVVFIVPSFMETTINAYSASKAAEFGLHHFIAFIMAGIVGAYIFSARMFLGQIGRAISSPMIIAIWALCLQHFWELLTESWKVFSVPTEEIEGVEKIFLIISAVAIIYSVNRLKALSKA